jgi:hypothetical protein
MTDRATLTARYLDAVTRHGAAASDLRAVIPATGMLGATPQQRVPLRPLFISHAEGLTAGLHDLQHLRTALISLPDRLYGGDFAAFAAT